MKGIWSPPPANEPGLVASMPRLDGELASEDSTSLSGQLPRLREAVMDDLAILHRLQGGGPVSEETRQLLSVRYIWLVDTLRELNAPVSSPSRRKTFAFLLVIAVWQKHLQVRQHVLNDIQISDTFLAELTVLLKSFRLELSVPDDAPLNQKELVERMKVADLAEDWASLIDQAQRFPLPEVDGWFSQAVCCLYQLASDRLSEVLVNSPDWINTAVTLSALTHSEAFAIATHAKTARAYFAALVLVGTGNALPEGACQSNLKEMLRTLSLDLCAWKRILEAFNRYPVRYPWLQRALGTTLASVSLEAIVAYVESVPVSTSEGCATQVDACLSEFTEHARDNVRVVLWQRAYEKWESWGFQQPGRTALNAPAISTFDYAVVGWLKEGCTEAFVATELEVLELQIGTLENDWHESITAFNGKLNQLLSRYQVFVHARDSISVDWTARGVAKHPRVLDSGYATLRYGI